VSRLAGNWDTSLRPETSVNGGDNPPKNPSRQPMLVVGVRALANTGCLASESRRLEKEFLHLQVDPLDGKLERPTVTVG